MHAGCDSGVLAVNGAFDLVCDLLATTAAAGDLPTRLAPRLCAMCNAQVCVFGELIGDVRSALARWQPRAEHGWQSDSQRSLLVSSFDDPAARNPVVVELLTRPGDFRTPTRRELVPDDSWYSSRYFTDFRRGAGLDDQLVSIWTGPIAGNGTSWVGVIGLHRSAGEPPFDETTTGLVDLLHRRLSATMWSANHTHANGRVSVPAPASEARSETDLESLARSLSRAERRVLPHMLEGHREERIAELLSRSRHTIHDHISSIYRVFGVHNRVELILRFGPELRSIAERLAQEAAERGPGHQGR